MPGAALVLGLCPMAAGAAGAPRTDRVIPMSYAAEGPPLGLASVEAFGLHLMGRPSPYLPFTKMPPGEGHRYYDQFSIAGSTFLVITERSEPPKLYLDANGNGDMTDDEGPFLGEDREFLPNSFTLRVPYPKEKVVEEYRLWMFQPPGGNGSSRFHPACHRVGELDLPTMREPFSLVLFDADADGDYSDDPLVIDLDRDGAAQENEKILPGRSITFGGIELRLKAVAPSGRSVTFSAGSVPEGPFAASRPDERLDTVKSNFGTLVENYLRTFPDGMFPHRVAGAGPVRRFVLERIELDGLKEVGARQFAAPARMVEEGGSRGLAVEFTADFSGSSWRIVRVRPIEGADSPGAPAPAAGRRSGRP